MVDINKKKGGKKKKKKKKSSSSKSGKQKGSKSKSGGGSSSKSTEPYQMTDETTANAEAAEVSTTSQRWSSEGAELNFDAGSGGSEKQYIQRQIQECEEFYNDYVETAKDNITDINQFTLYHHALLLSMAKNRAGICDIFMKRFGYSEGEALQKARQVCQKAGEPEAFVELTDEVTTSIRED
jgi:hypothetical protein